MLGKLKRRLLRVSNPPQPNPHLQTRWSPPKIRSVRSGRLASGDALSAENRRLLCKGRPRLLPLHTATVVRCVVSPAATALRLLPLQPVFEAYFVLNTCRYRRPSVVTRATLGRGRSQSLQSGAGEVLNARVDNHLVVQFRIERN